MLLFKRKKGEQSIRNYIVPITSLLLILLSTGLYGENDEQPRWNTTLFGSALACVSDYGGIYFGFGGAVGYNLNSKVGLEGEVSVTGANVFAHGFYIFSGGVVLGNSETKPGTLSPYLMGGAAFTFGGFMGGMLGGGIKIRLKKELLRFDARFYFASGGIITKLFFGWMWTF